MQRVSHGHLAGQPRMRDHRSERRLMQFLIVLSYPPCLMAAVAGRLGHIFENGRAPAGESVFAEARSAACAAVGYAFRG